MLKPFHDLAPVVAEMVGPMPYPALNSAFDALYPSGLRHYWKANFVKELTDDAIAAHVEHGSKVPELTSTMHIYPINGACHRVAPESTAFAYRDANFATVIAGHVARREGRRGEHRLGPGLLRGHGAALGGGRLHQLHGRGRPGPDPRQLQGQLRPAGRDQAHATTPATCSGTTRTSRLPDVDTDWEIFESGPGRRRADRAAASRRDVQRSFVRGSDGRARAGGDPADRGHACPGMPARRRRRTSASRAMRGSRPSSRRAPGPTWSSASAWARRWRTRWWSPAPSRGPVVLLGVSLSAADEPGFFRAIIRLGSILGTLPAAVLKKGAASMVKHAPVPPDRQAQLRADFARNNTRDMRRGLQAYLRWLHRDDDPARRLCEAGVPAWVVHAEKGDGGLTRTSGRCSRRVPQVRVVTMPGQVFFLPNEVPERIADVIVQALAEV